MTPVRSNPIPLPAAVLMLSVAVCLGASGAAGASPMLIERATQAEQRQAFEHLLDALQQAAKGLTHRLVGQAALAQRDAIRPALALGIQPVSLTDDATPRVLRLRDALLNLPPPMG